ncbi:MAG: chemotaxis protein CheD [Actinobacteria bacterium]|nr:chemotaxis protein CheD [Actinomycetota bacterium]
MNFPVSETAGSLHPVRMGEMSVSKKAVDVLSIVGLGSCVALVMLAREQGVAGMAHIVLPASEMAGRRDVPPAKFADTAVPEMLRAMRSFGVRPEAIHAVVIGGATMFGQKPGSKLAGVGDRNVVATLEALSAQGIPVIGQDAGGTSGRSVQVYVGEGRVLTKSGLEQPFEVGGVAADTSRRTAEKPAQPSFPESIWASAAEGKLTA